MGETGKILVVDDERSARDALQELLEGSGYAVRTVRDGAKAVGLLEEWRPDVLLTDLKMPVMGGMELIKTVRDQRPEMPCIVMTAFGSIENAVEAMKAGADDYLTKPLNYDAVELLLDRTMERVELRRELHRLQGEQDPDKSGPEIIGESPVMREVVAMVDQVAESPSTILVTGESGTGKELIAERLHFESDRADEPLVRLNCAALSEHLLESELFGHEKGSFTGATEQRSGRFEQADGGTLFLDEVAEIPESTQVKLLRFLEQRAFERVGGNETISVDVRIVAATNRDLEEAVRDGDFREDLYFRFDVVNIQLPPLRARREDIPLLAHHFVAHHAEVNDKLIDRIAPDVLEAFQAYDWPGNVRELENIVERAVVMADGETLRVEHLPRDFGAPGLVAGEEIRIPGSALEEIERHAILKTYKSTGGSTSETADILDVSTRKIQYKIKEYRDDWPEIDETDGGE